MTSIATIGTIIGKTTGSTVDGIKPNNINSLSVGMVVLFTSAIGGLLASTPYYVHSINVPSNYFKVSDTLTGPAKTTTESETTIEFMAIDTTHLTSNVVVNNNYQYFQIDYGDFAERIASSLESIATSLSTVTTLATTSGIRVIDPWRYIEIYETVRNLEQESVSLTEIVEKIKRIPKDWNRPVRDWD
jgi:hypothetical protein